MTTQQVKNSVRNTITICCIQRNETNIFNTYLNSIKMVKFNEFISIYCDENVLIANLKILLECGSI